MTLTALPLTINQKKIITLSTYYYQVMYPQFPKITIKNIDPIYYYHGSNFLAIIE